VALEGQREIQIDLRVVESAAYGAALQYFTGSKEHNVRLRERAIAKKWRLNEYGLYDGEKRIAGKTEEEIYKTLGLPCFPPELREDRGEFEGTPPADLVRLADIHGDLHLHTTASDGRCTIEEMAGAAKALGYEYIAICDHSKSSVIANGLTVERMVQHIDAIHSASRRMKGFTILAGCECDILPDGSLDYPDEVLARCDWVVASVHTARGSTKVTATDRTLAAIANRYVCAVGHPTGRLINKRAAADIDISVIAAAAARNHTILEINASWQRLDLKDVHARTALAAGADLVIDTDAHHTDQLDQMRFGVITARRAGAAQGRIVNCLPIKELRKRIEKKRTGR
jgi:DNA polymerase (family 10)